MNNKNDPTARTSQPPLAPPSFEEELSRNSDARRRSKLRVKLQVRECRATGEILRDHPCLAT
ncbi:hypothetical protein WH47_03224 [Habropoda laboriosa]|uniref:Uncharacterized protein n=1 Tax=Habropoda laboriosa TaxID=597456 RepID=A0A0L7RBE1_9HYME|nr:hypothetical protein WH47_03224 [Habropoda laboriosa]